ncbi:MAG: UpxY family transcription antiterminator [Nitrospinae bacterium]|nr:UpxY family transcription antiterminator [Nitrospinota bacterium]
MSLNWYAVRTRSHHEQKVHDILMGKSFNVFYPTIDAWSRRKDRKKRVKRPLFSGYLFVECELDNYAWLEIKKTHGVVNLVGFSDRPEPIPSEQIHSIQTILNAGIIPRPHPYLNEGDKVIVIEGPLKGAIGIYNRFDHVRGKLIVSLDLLGRSVEVEIESWAVEQF